MDELSGAADAENEVLALTLSAHTDVLTELLRGLRTCDGDPALTGLAASRALARVLDDAQRALVAQARSGGRSWAEVGKVLHVSRQAAYQRFGPPAGNRPDGADASPEAVDLAVRTVDDFLHERWEVMRERFDTRMRECCSVDALHDAWESCTTALGAPETTGTATVAAVSGYTTVDVPVDFARGSRRLHVAVAPNGQVAGFFVLPGEDETR